MPDHVKAAHKTYADATRHVAEYEETAFGRRRITRMPNWLRAIGRLVGKAISIVYRRK
jgi:hypothetical protein